jgi:hypothetical protein
MPLAATDLTQLGETPITILSNFYPNIYMRMDTTGVNSSSSTGGTVNCEYGIDSQAQFKIRPQSDGTYAFESAASPGVFLRMDATGTPTDMSAGGTVNCQYGIADAKEKFNAYANADGSFSFESAAMPTYYLRLVTGSGVTAATGPGGTVNCQYNAKGGGNESFFLNMANQVLPFNIQRQTQVMWCWDATAVSVALFYDAQARWTQCSLANTVLSTTVPAGTDCCTLNANQVSPCGNNGCWPDRDPTGNAANGPLQVVQHYTQTINRALTPVEIGVQIANRRPVVCNINWQNGGGHIIVVRGRSLVNGVDNVSVGDPGDGSTSDVVYTALTQGRYTAANGTWNFSYPTR